MRTAALDRRVRKEARLLVREARRAGARGKRAPEGLGEAAREVEGGLAAGDLARVRRALPRLDELAGELPRPRPSLVAEYAWAFGSLIAIVLSIRMFVVEAFKIPSSSMLPTLEINDHIFVNKFIYGLRVPLSDRKVLARSPDRGAVIVFIQPCQKIDYIKRVVGLAGDRIEVRCNVLHVNGRAVPSAHVPGPCALLSDPGSSATEPCSRYRETLGGFTYDTVHRPDRPRWDAARHLPGDAAANDFPQLPVEKRCTDSAIQQPGRIVTERTADAAGPCGTYMHYVVPAGHVFVMGDNRDSSNDSRYWGAVPIESIKGKALFLWLSYRDLTWSGMQWGRMGNFVH